MKKNFEIIDGEIKNICPECGEEMRSLLHKCNPFRNINWVQID